MSIGKHIAMALVAAGILLAAGCDKYTVSGLDNSVDARINALIDGYVDRLTDSEYGWIASIRTNKGYYRFWFDFAPDGKVEMYTDNNSYPEYRTRSMTSTYVFRALQRPTLVFDSYSYVHIINNPDNDISKGSGNKGLETDFEFEVERLDQATGTFYMKGRFNKVPAIFRKATAADVDGVKTGKMMDGLSTYSNTKWANKYLRTTYNSTELVLKLADNRNLYEFWYDTRTGEGFDGGGYYNAEIDGSNNLFFPEPIAIDDVSITGVRFNPSTATYSEFMTEDPAVNIPLEIQSTASDGLLLIGDLLGPVGSGKMFEQASGGNMKIPEAGYTSNALDIMSKMLFNGGFNLVLSYDLNYFFTTEVTAAGEEKIYFNVHFTPKGFGYTTITGGETVNVITAYPRGEYRFDVSSFDERDLSFTLSNAYTTNQGGRDYIAAAIMTDVVNGFRNKRFRIQWSEIARESGVIIEFMPIKTSGGRPSYATDFIPPAVLSKRTL